MTVDEHLKIRLPATKTGFMSLLQTLVAHGATRWVGGQLKREKLPSLAKKFAAVYPICRPTRGRTYDKQIGRAVVTLVAFPVGETVYWMLLSTPGRSGLADRSMPDFKAAKDTMRAGEHIQFGDYRLVYAKKKEPREVMDKKTGLKKTILSDASAWTWQMTNDALSQVKAMLREQRDTYAWGTRMHDGKPFGIRTCLAQQARRPLFSGVRSQVIELNRYAAKEWGQILSFWRANNPRLVERDGKLAGTLVPLNEVVRNLPKMVRLPVYGEKPMTIGHLDSYP